MRIAIITGSFLPAVGGIEWKVHHLATEYVKCGHETIVYTIRPPAALRDHPQMVRPTYGLVRCGAPLRGMGRLGINGWLITRRVIADHRQNPFDVLHCHHLALPAKWGAAIRRRTGVPVVVTTCGEDVMTLPEEDYGVRLNPRFDRMIRANVRSVDVIGSVCRAIRADLEAMHTTARIVDIPNGVAADEFSPARSTFLRDRLNLKANDLIVLSVGRNFHLKRFDVGIEAFARLADRVRNAYYVLVGRDMNGLEDHVRRHRLEGRVRFLEQVPLNDLPPVYQSSDVFLNPSMIEGFAQVNAQALACGLPLVITDAPGNVDAADHGGAVVARTNDAASIADALERLLTRTDARRRLAEEAVAASRHYHWQRIGDQYLGIFDELVAARRAAGRRACPGTP